MKKLFLGAIAAMTLAACSQEEDFETQNVQKKVNGIEYNVSTKNQSRVAASFSSTNLPQSFKVWALKSSDNSAYINGKTITKGADGTYAAETADTWPGEVLNFYATVDGEATITSGAAAVKDFTVASDAANQVDLLYAATPNLSSGTVGINFKHALSQVCFKAKNSNTNISVTLKSVGIGGLNDKGTYTLPSTSDNTGAWGTLSNSGSGLAEYKVSLGDNGIALTSEAQALTGSTDAGILAVIPQKQSKLNVTSGTTISTSTKDGAYFILNAVVKSSGDDASEIYTGDIYVPVSVNFVEGTRYTYTLTFSTGDGGYRDNGTAVIGGTSGIAFEVTTSNYSDQTIETESSTQNTLTLYPTADTYVRDGNTTDYSTAATMEICDKTFTKSSETESTAVKMYGLMQFEIPAEVIANASSIKSATLYLVSERNKGAKAVSIYSIDTYGTKYEDISSSITSSLASTAIISEQTIAGESGKAITDAIAVDTYGTVSAWTNSFDLKTYISGLSAEGAVNFLLSSSHIEKDESFKFYTSDAADVTNTKVNPNITFSKDDLKPRLVIVY